MSQRRHEDNINDLKRHFTSVIDWVSTVFRDIEKEMCGLEWGRLYSEYSKKPYDPADFSDKLKSLYSDFYVKNKKGVYEYILGGCSDNKLLDIRIFDEATKKASYEQQTKSATEQGKSNCPLCAVGENSNKDKIWEIREMDADHVTAWSKGGATIKENCEMLCKTHNRAKGNR